MLTSLVVKVYIEVHIIFRFFPVLIFCLFNRAIFPALFLRPGCVFAMLFVNALYYTALPLLR